LLAILFLAACRETTGEQGPFVAATATATPRSTPLPAVATTVPPGIEENPIQMVLNPVGSASLVTDTQIANFEEAVAADSGLVVKVTLVDRYAEALAALCDSTPTNVTVAWLDGLTYRAAVAQGCGEPVMQVEHGRSNANSGDPGQIIAASGLSSVQTLRGRTFCRLGYDDYYSWLVPSIIMQANGVDPVNDLEAVEDYDTYRALAQAVIDGDCDAAGMSESEFDDLSGALKEELTVVETTPPFPYGILMYPISLPLGERIRLDNALLAMDIDSEGSDAMRPLLGQDGLIRVADDDFEMLTEFLDSTGLDFAQLGN
jgi:ABC-type phosphate/phosphonate transport system substrate-binding protein